MADVYVASFPGVTKDEALKYVAGQAQRVKLREQIMATFPSQYGGFSFDPATGVESIFVTDEASAGKAQQLAQVAGVTARTTLVSRGYAALEDLSRKINSGVFVGLPATASVDVENNEVRLEVSAARLSVTAKLAATIGPIRVTTPSGAEFVEDVCTSRSSCGAPLRGGVIIKKSDGSPGTCSLGYTARANDGSRWGITAGHCSVINQQWSHGNEAIGPVRATLNSGPIDIARIRIDNPYWLSQGGGWLYNGRQPDAPLPLVLSITGRATIANGDSVCLDAQYSTVADGCGYIADNSAQRMRVGGFDGCPGDSGGSWVYPSPGGGYWAYGVHSDSSDGCHVAGGSSVFTSVPDMNYWMDSVSAVGANLRIETR